MSHLLAALTSALALLGPPGATAQPAAPELAIYMMTMPPHVMDTPGEKGMVGDIVLEAMRRAGFKPRILVEPNPRAMMTVQAQSDTFITALARVPQREGLYTWVAPIVPIHRAFFTRDTRIDSLEEGRKLFKAVAVSRGTANYDLLVSAGFRPEQLVPVNQGDTAPKMLLAGHVDAWFNLIPESKEILKRMGAPALVAGAPLAPTDLYLACSRQCNPDTVARLVKALKSMQADGTTLKLLNHYRIRRPDTVQ